MQPLEIETTLDKIAWKPSLKLLKNFKLGFGSGQGT